MNDAWQSYEAKGKDKPPKVPEPSTYGAISLGAMIVLVVLYLKLIKKTPERAVRQEDTEGSKEK